MVILHDLTREGHVELVFALLRTFTDTPEDRKQYTSLAKWLLKKYIHKVAVVFCCRKTSHCKSSSQVSRSLILVFWLTINLA